MHRVGLLKRATDAGARRSGATTLCRSQRSRERQDPSHMAILMSLKDATASVRAARSAPMSASNVRRVIS